MVVSSISCADKSSVLAQDVSEMYSQHIAISTVTANSKFTIVDVLFLPLVISLSLNFTQWSAAMTEALIYEIYITKAVK